MTNGEKPAISARKAPRQVRSSQLVDDILAAAARVLAEEGAHRFTTARVAERAGVSVGSLYQYFPNKAAILFRLQTDEWKQNADLLSGILKDRSMPPFDRLDRLVHVFIRSECDEAEMRIALDDAAPYYRDAPEAQEPRIRGTEIVAAFMAELLPHVAPDRRTVAADVLMMTLADVGKRISETNAPADHVETYADAVTEMFRAYLQQIGGGSE